MDRPLMPQATAIWLIENTALTFEQIGDFCGLHLLEIEGIANEDVAQGIRGIDPVASGQTTRADLERCARDPGERLKMAPPRADLPELKRRRGPRYTPLSQRRDRPDAIAWLVRNHAELTDGQISRLVGTTKATIVQIRDRTHWNTANIKPVDPVTLGLCSQVELDAALAKAARAAARGRGKKTEAEAEAAPAAAPVAVESGASAQVEKAERTPEKTPEKKYDPASVFAKLKEDREGE